jgi:hypothetical protein
MMHGVRGFFRFAHIDGLITADPAVYARLPKIHSDESRTQGLDRLGRAPTLVEVPEPPVREIFPVLPGARPMREHSATTTLRSTKLT